MLRRVAVIAAFAALLVAAPAGADTVRAKRIKSPSGLIHCYALQYGGHGIECMAPYLAEIGQLDTYYGLKREGKARVGERGDYPGFNAPERTLGYGDTWKWKGIRCKMRKRGLTCRNRSGHGFRLARGAVRRF